MWLYVYILYAIIFASDVNGHGYFSSPQGRISWCFEGTSNVPGMWFPPGGSSIRDTACRLAYQYVMNKHGGNTPIGNERAMVQFRDRNEFANFNNNRRWQDLPKIMPDGQICAAGNNYPINGPPQFGDKTGADQKLPWRKTKIYAKQMYKYQLVEFIFCATMPHSPSSWHFFIQHGNPAKQQVSWRNLSLIATFPSMPLLNGPALPNCFSLGSPIGRHYKFNVPIPMIPGDATLMVYWQRFDHTEFFIQCVDIEVVKSKSPQLPFINNYPNCQMCQEPNCLFDNQVNSSDIHPQRYWSCDNFGKSLLNWCPENEIFTTKLHCESMLNYNENNQFKCQDFSLLYDNEIPPEFQSHNEL